jgi:hypothetical protein
VAKRSSAGKRGRRGAAGAAGAKGATGPKGQRGAPASRNQVLAAVADQFEEIRKQLDLQLIRTGQVQADLDRQRNDAIDLRQQLRVVQSLLKKAMRH